MRLAPLLADYAARFRKDLPPASKLCACSPSFEATASPLLHFHLQGPHILVCYQPHMIAYLQLTSSLGSPLGLPLGDLRGVSAIRATTTSGAGIDLVESQGTLMKSLPAPLWGEKNTFSLPPVRSFPAVFSHGSVVSH
ncbi:hypothetical protein B0F90DRAFT_1671641 [Multifurca ochricompacta]|uniref:Uncharacterized protein n=1 Tax=Multifurca ochricompacta TaxID=376703 RepID=A0AAD4LVI9_9AGAM|nr:hypothetical protein B0F90DRAFT_1671641 [Multifurca ochricompacta]